LAGEVALHGLLGGKWMKYLDNQFDERSDCVSILVSMSLSEYKNIAESSFKSGNGNLEGQRKVITRSSVANKIKKRMNSDFEQKAVFPQVVLGLLLNDESFVNIKNDAKKFSMEDVAVDKISIIDGMQRSFIYFTNFEGNEDREIRVEFWVSNKSIKLLYRMLVLNTGQVPWTTRRQIELIYSNLFKTIETSLYSNYPELLNKVGIMGIDDGQRRSKSGKFRKDTMIELYLAFNTRKARISRDDEIADEFQRFDMIESIKEHVNFKLFIDVFAYLCKLDIAFSNFTSRDDNGQFKEPKDILSSEPACVGFAVACAEFIMGKITVTRTESEKLMKATKLKTQIENIISRLTKESENQNNEDDFFALSSLNESVAQLSKKRIGDEMRDMFKKVFEDLFRYEEMEEIPSLEAFWRT